MKSVKIARVPDDRRKGDTRYFVMVDMTDEPDHGVQVWYMKSATEPSFGDKWYPDRETCVYHMELSWGVSEFAWKEYTGPRFYE